MKDTFGPEGLVPFIIVFGVYISTHISKEPSKPKPTLQERGKLANLGRAEMDIQMILLRVSKALRHDVPPASSSVYEIVNHVLVFCRRQANNRSEEWFGSFSVYEVDKNIKMVFVSLNSIKSYEAFGYAHAKMHHLQEIFVSRHFTDLGDALTNFGS